MKEEEVEVEEERKAEKEEKEKESFCNIDAIKPMAGRHFACKKGECKTSSQVKQTFF